MTDRFRFRAWNKKNESMILYVENCSNFFEFTSDRDLSLMQCTGLRDKNGKLIYEGDVVIDWKDRIYQVLWNEGAIWFKGQLNMERLCTSCISFYELKIIGNIYENPELMGAKHDR